MTKILLVEDSKFLRLSTERALARAGYEMSSAADGDEALLIAREKLPDLILLDMLLPKMSGPEVLAALKKDPVTKAIPVVVMTGLSQKECCAATRRRGCRLPGKVCARIGQGIGKITDGRAGDGAETSRGGTDDDGVDARGRFAVDLLPLIRLLQAGDIYFVHLEHSLHHPVCFCGIFIPKHCA